MERPEHNTQNVLPELGEETEEMRELFRRLVKEAEDDPRPGIPHEEVFAALKRKHRTRVKRVA